MWKSTTQTNAGCAVHVHPTRSFRFVSGLEAEASLLQVTKYSKGKDFAPE